jgi:hypothetical protein
MATNQLSDFDRDLCDYILGQIRPHLRTCTVMPNGLTELDYDGFHRLDLPDWLGRVVAKLPASLADHVWAGVHSEPVVRSLTDAELNALIFALADSPLRCEAEAVWVPFDGLHRRAVECVPLIAKTLTRQTAEEWASNSHAFATALMEDNLSLAAGVGVVRDWLRHIRRLQEVIASPVTPPRSANRRPAQQPDADQPLDMLTPRVVEKRYSVSRSTLYAACRTGQLPHYRVPARKGGRGKYLFRPADVLNWLDALRVDGAVAPPPATPSPSASAPASSRPAPASPATFSELNPNRLARAWSGG